MEGGPLVRTGRLVPLFDRECVREPEGDEDAVCELLGELEPEELSDAVPEALLLALAVAEQLRVALDVPLLALRRAIRRPGARRAHA